MAVSTYTASGSKASTPAKLSKDVFGVEVPNHQLLKQAYETYLANGRENLALTKKRGDVSGGGKKPWKQKGTGRARFGSSRVPIWRGGGVAFGPTGNQNYTMKLSVGSKRTALRQALSLANKAGKLIVIDTFACPAGKTKETIKLLETQKITKEQRVLLVVSVKDDMVRRATNNVNQVKAIQAMYLNVFDILNADKILVSKKALDLVSEWLRKESK